MVLILLRSGVANGGGLGWVGLGWVGLVVHVLVLVLTGLSLSCDVQATIA